MLGYAGHQYLMETFDRAASRRLATLHHETSDFSKASRPGGSRGTACTVPRQWRETKGLKLVRRARIEHGRPYNAITLSLPFRAIAGLGATSDWDKYR